MYVYVAVSVKGAKQFKQYGSSEVTVLMSCMFMSQCQLRERSKSNNTVVQKLLFLCPVSLCHSVGERGKTSQAIWWFRSHSS